MQNKKLDAALLASLLSQTDKSVAKRSTMSNNDLSAIIQGTEILYQQMDQALTRIHKATQKTHKVAEQIARSPREIKIIKDLDALRGLPQPGQSWTMKSPAMQPETGAGDALRPSI
jgi:hypothetical protein